MPRHWIVVGVAFVWLLGAPAKGWPIIIETEKGQRVSGFLIEQSARELSIKTVSEDGNETVGKYDRSKVKIIHQGDVARLAKLHPDNPRDYRDYADELAEKHSDDPEAKELARRLYLHAAFLEPGKLGGQCLVAMCNVARNATEARRIRALAYLLDPKRHAGLLEEEPGEAVKAKEPSWNEFRKALRYLRSGNVAEALSYSKKPGVAACFANLPDLVSLEGFQQLCEDMACRCKGGGSVLCSVCKGGTARTACNNCSSTGRVTCPECDGRGVARDLTASQLRMILKAELRLEEKDIHPNQKRGGSSWSVQLSNRSAAPVRDLSLETVTEIDPRKCIYRDGKWLEP